MLGNKTGNTKLHEVGDIVHVFLRRKRGHFCLPAIVVNSDVNADGVESLDLGVMSEAYTYREDQYEGQWHDVGDCTPE